MEKTNSMILIGLSRIAAEKIFCVIAHVMRLKDIFILRDKRDKLIKRLCECDLSCIDCNKNK